MTKAYKILWYEHRLSAITFLVLIAAIGFQIGAHMIRAHQDAAFFDKLQALESKSEAHQMILNNFAKCMLDDEEVESNCITNTILLAEVNGYKPNIGAVFHDAGIPRK
ncbi:hypothetical protein IFT48_02195 [Pseudomonas fluorescens]|uniref:hypothetical protein n=1 Tax=Pseudomonas fluorescens TaxID=294 RepID=UPI001930C696|nr:hypothetical protein [Pseudomonas fluorescens]MBD8088774.1 hypothetical protein [Pseudomonas fluorescens]